MKPGSVPNPRAERSVRSTSQEPDVTKPLPIDPFSPPPSSADQLAEAERIFDLLRGVSALTRSDLVADLAHAVADHPEAALSVAFNHKQIASKTWLRDALFDTLGGTFQSIWVLGGWYGVLAALLHDDPRYAIDRIVSFDIDPACAPVAETLNRRSLAAGRFEARTAAMETLDYAGPDAPDLVICTSCEHIVDLRAALARMPLGTQLVLQSNDYRREPDHVSCVDSVEAFRLQADLGTVLFEDALPTRNYTRFMLIGRR